jgi:cytochrome b561
LQEDPDYCPKRLAKTCGKRKAGIAHLLQFQDLIGLVQDLGSKRQQQQLRPPNLHMQTGFSLATLVVNRVHIEECS